MMVPPLFHMRLCSLSVPSAAVLDDPTLVTTTFIRITGSVSSDSVVIGFVVEWQRDTSVGCSDEDERTISENGDLTSYTITGLEPGNRYTITVTVSNSAGTAPDSNTVTAMTPEAGEREYNSTSLTLSCYSPQLRLILQCLEKALSQPEVSQLSGMSWLVWTVME